MLPANYFINLIEAIKSRDSALLDKSIKDAIKMSEKKGQHKIAKVLRDLYSKPNKYFDHSSTDFKTKPSSFSPKINSTLFDIRDSRVSSKNIILSKKNKELLEEISRNYNNKIILSSHNLTAEAKILLYGPPGTGKTLFAYVLANELGLPIFHVYLDAVVSSFLGETGKNIKAIFSEASKTDCILFLDEFDAIAKHRDDQHELGELKRVVTVLLQNIDELSDRTILVAATNHPHLLDPAIWRRFDYQLNIENLGSEARAELFKLKLSEHHFRGKINYKLLGDISEDLSAAVIDQLINKALRNYFLGILESDLSLETLIIEQIIINHSKHSDPLKRPERDSFIKAIKKLREIDEKYTYELLEDLTGVASSTLHNLVSKI